MLKPSILSSATYATADDGVEAAPHALVELAQLVFVVGVVERQHRHQVLDGRKPFRRAVPRLAGWANRASSDSGCAVSRACELPHQRVELGVGNLRSRVNVVELFVAANLSAQVLDSFGGGHATYKARASESDTRTLMRTATR